MKRTHLENLYWDYRRRVAEKEEQELWTPRWPDLSHVKIEPYVHKTYIHWGNIFFMVTIFTVTILLLAL